MIQNLIEDVWRERRKYRRRNRKELRRWEERRGSSPSGTSLCSTPWTRLSVKITERLNNAFSCNFLLLPVVLLQHFILIFSLSSSHSWVFSHLFLWFFFLSLKHCLSLWQKQSNNPGNNYVSHVEYQQQEFLPPPAFTHHPPVLSHQHHICPPHTVFMASGQESYIDSYGTLGQVYVRSPYSTTSASYIWLSNSTRSGVTVSWERKRKKLLYIVNTIFPSSSRIRGFAVWKEIKFFYLYILFRVTLSS